MKKFWEEIVGENQGFTTCEDDPENWHCLIGNFVTDSSSKN